MPIIATFINFIISFLYLNSLVLEFENLISYYELIFFQKINIPFL